MWKERGEEGERRGGEGVSEKGQNSQACGLGDLGKDGVCYEAGKLNRGISVGRRK